MFCSCVQGGKEYALRAHFSLPSIEGGGYCGTVVWCYGTVVLVCGVMVL